MAKSDPPHQPAQQRLRRTVTIAAAVAVGGMVLFYGATAAWIATPSAAERAAGLLTKALGQPVSVGRLRLAGTTLSVENLAVSSPEAGDRLLLRIPSLRITPDLLPLLAGQRRLRSLVIDGGELSLSRDAGGRWNFDGIRRRLSAPRTAPPTEFRIRHLALRDCAVSLEGKGIRHLSVGIADLSSSGSTTSSMDIAGTVSGGDPFRLWGSLRGGATPALDLSLRAPRIPLETVVPLTPLRTRFAGDGSFGMELTARLREGDFNLSARIPLAGALVADGGSRLPLNGSLSLEADYRLRDDRGRVSRCDLDIQNLLRFSGSAVIRQAKGAGAFVIDGSLEQLQLHTLAPLLPAALKESAVAGTVRIPSLHISGDRRQGATAGRASLQLRDGALAYRGRTILAGSGADMLLERRGPAWELSGTFTQEKGDSALVRELSARLSARLGPTFRPLAITAAPFRADIMGGTVTGTASYAPGAPAPLSASLSLERTPVSALAPFLPPGKLVLSSGTISARIDAAGASPRNLAATYRLQLSGLAGRAAATPFEAAVLSTEGRFSRIAGAPALDGSAHLSKGRMGERTAAAAFRYALAGNTLTLSGLEAGLAGISLRVATLSAPLPRPAAKPGGPLPLRLTVAGGTVRSGQHSADGISGSLDTTITGSGANRRLLGNAALEAAAISSAGQGLGKASLRVRFDHGGAVAHLAARLAGGEISATAAGDPFDPSAATFSLEATGLSAPDLARLSPRPLPVDIAGGHLMARASGSLHRGTGVAADIRCELRDLALARGRKTIVDGAGLSATGRLAGSILTLDQGLLSLGDGVTATITGRMQDVFAPTRSAALRLQLPPTPTPLLHRALINNLPAPLQQATATGSVGIDAGLRLAGGSSYLDGDAVLQQITLELPTQKISAGPVNGRLPFSVTVGKGLPPAVADLRLPASGRAGFGELLRLFSTAGNGSTVTIDRLQAGALQLGKTTMNVSAGGGRTDLVSLSSDLYGGLLLGRGTLASGSGIDYGATLLVSNLSLRSLCDGIPAIRGYLSGRVDGLVELYRENGGGSVAGRLDLWTRSGNGERMLVSREFLQKLAGKNLKGLFFRSDRPFDNGELSVFLDEGYLTFDRLDISHTNLLGVRDLSVSVAAVQNRIALGHLLQAVRDAAQRGTAAAKGAAPQTPQVPAPEPEMELDWLN